MNELDRHTLDQKSWAFLNLIGQTPLIFQATTITFSTMVGVSVLSKIYADTGFALQMGANGGVTWQFNAAAFNPTVAQDNLQSLGDPVARIKQVFTPIIDSGTTGPVIIKTNNGTTQLTIKDDGFIRPNTGYESSDTSQGIDTSITSANLVGKTITVKDGLITAFA